MTEKQKQIQLSDADFKQRLYSVAESICQDMCNDKRKRLISLSGPTCSGKTTAAGMLSQYMKKVSSDVVIISIDDFYYDREYLHVLSQKKGLDRIDYDSVDTIDTQEIKSFCEEMFSTGQVHCPIFNFKTGTREGYRLISADKDTTFIFEGIQAIYPQISSILEPYGSTSVYIAPLTPIVCGDKSFSSEEIRFMRRLVRDNNFRGADAEFTMYLWESVRENEEKNIYPYIDSCRYKIDSTHGYELGILKPYLDRILSHVKSESKYYDTARNILNEIADIEPVSSEYISLDSLYKEFV